ncbi:hypothetical protein RD110_20240 [Rhodoferax koreense]|uniref:Calcineurin-like phosphoesterase domain-containing protein n=2 Tax=Rhodoferax koreensis TaxID=1842727 RepID=A0A1P8JZU2_9BURK|nr:hypothetical protein RD110_20240 [Rhodoferax koreense]
MTMGAGTLLHLSDTHFGTAQPKVIEALVRLVRMHAPGQAILSGDVTQRATGAQFAEARAFVDRLAIAHCMAIPGNHDIPLLDLPARLFQPYARYRAAFGDVLAPELQTPAWCLLSNNTTRWYRHKHGEISHAQIADTARRLAVSVQANPLQIRVVAVHQPIAVQQAGERKNMLRGAASAVKAWAAAGADIVLGGHIHLPFVVPLHRRAPWLPATPNGAAPRPMWAVQAGTAVSSRTRPGAPNSVNLLRADCTATRRRCAVERWDYLADADAFVLVHTDLLELAAPLSEHTSNSF